MNLLDHRLVTTVIDDLAIANFEMIDVPGSTAKRIECHVSRLVLHDLMNRVLIDVSCVMHIPKYRIVAPSLCEFSLPRLKLRPNPLTFPFRFRPDFFDGTKEFFPRVLEFLKRRGRFHSLKGLTSSAKFGPRLGKWL